MLNRPVEVKICDFCKSEVSSLTKCVICKRDMCFLDGGCAHTSYKIGEVYRYADGERIIGYVCKECAEKRTSLTIGELLDGVLSDKPVPTCA